MQGISGPYACPDGQSINTAIGCIPVNNINSLVGFFLRWMLGVGAAAAFMLIIFAAFQIITSSGEPEKIKAAQQLITAAVSGLLLIIFSVFILQLIGANILRLPGL